MQQECQPPHRHVRWHLPSQGEENNERTHSGQLRSGTRFESTTFHVQIRSICKIWGFHGGDYDDYHLLGDEVLIRATRCHLPEDDNHQKYLIYITSNSKPQKQETNVWPVCSLVSCSLFGILLANCIHLSFCPVLNINLLTYLIRSSYTFMV
jgi:hypothetical protein